MEKVLVTGGNGLVGRAIQNVYQQKYKSYQFIFLSSKDCDLTNIEETVNI